MAYCKGCKSKTKCKTAGKCLATGKKLKMAMGGTALKKAPASATGLKKLPTNVRNKMGYMKSGGYAKKK